MILTTLSFLRLIHGLFIIRGDNVSWTMCEREIKNEEGKQNRFLQM